MLAVCLSVVTTVAGRNGTAGYVDGNTPLQTQFNQPNSVSLDTSGTIVVADRNNNCIRLITPAGGPRRLHLCCWSCDRFDDGLHGALCRCV